jgi:bifunctional UDP-N-acetylglucosamine pyrophosphorylase/glucosamine-1-phosphate N-acetyltransferase
MLQHVIDAVKPLKPEKIIVVIGNGAETVRKRVHDESLSFVLQKKLLGTGDAVAKAKKELSKGTVLILNGDCPLIRTRTLKNLLTGHSRNRNVLSFLSFQDRSMSGYGRVLRDKRGRVSGIVEDRHATVEEKKKIDELNGGVYVLEANILNFLKRIGKNRSSGEYYLTDIVGLVSQAEKKLDAYMCPAEEIRGVNTRNELYEISEIMRKRIISDWMKKGVTFLDPGASFVHPLVSIGKETVIYPNTYLEGSSKIGKNCIIYPGVRIYDSFISDEVVIKDSTLIEESKVGKGSSVGPFAHLRPESTIGKNAKIGNFVEIKKSDIGDGTKASHLSYLGDAEVGSNVNIGAGTITCNYDGRNKFKTMINSEVFIGSDTQLVAPVRIGKGAYIAAGATVTKDVPSGALAISRTQQRNLNNWVRKRQKKVRSQKPEVRSQESGAKRK